MPQPLRSVLAVIAGFFTINIVVIVLTAICVHAMHLKSGHPTPGYLVFNVAYSLGAAFLGGYVAGWIGRRRPLAHGIVLAVVMLAFAVVFLLHPAASQPYWYQVFLALVPPLAAIGGSAVAGRPYSRYAVDQYFTS